jgi:hypothetical protein
MEFVPSSQPPQDSEDDISGQIHFAGGNSQPLEPGDVEFYTANFVGSSQPFEDGEDYCNGPKVRR